VENEPKPGPGSLIGGKYRLESLLGEGGMGAVWHARNVRLDLPVALKLLHPEVRCEDTMTRLLTEARVEAKLCHASIVRVFDYGETERGDAYIVMELLEGSSLGDLLDEHGPLPAEAAVRLLLPIIHGLCAAHRAGIVHRDLKPENIFIAQAGSQLQPKLLDFGIAKLHGELWAQMTVDGCLLGSPAYMAPEQARGLADVDQRADIWAMCVVLHELISGVNPFAADNQYAVLSAVVEREPPALTGPGCATLWPILQRGLIKDRNQRFANACELGEALARWLIEQGEREDACGEPLAWNWALSEPVSERPSDALVPIEPGVHDVLMSESRISHKPVTSTRPRWHAMLGANTREFTRAACVFALAPVLVMLLLAGSSHDEHPAHRVMPAARASAPTSAAQVFAATTAERVMQGAPASFSSELERDLESNASSAPVGSESAAPLQCAKTFIGTSAVPVKRAERPPLTEAALGLKNPFR
jgi:serine/threonine-protein kinase